MARWPAPQAMLRDSTKAALAQARRILAQKPLAGPSGAPGDSQEICVAANEYCGPDLFPQSRRLPVRLPGAHSCPRIHTHDRSASLRRRLHDQLGFQRLPRHPGAHLRSALRAGLPARAGRRKQRRGAGAGGDLPAQARGGRHEGRRARAHADGRAEERQARRLHRRRAGLAHRRARPGAAGLRGDGVRRRGQGRRLHPHADSALSPARERHRRRDGLCARPGRRVPRRRAHRVDAGADGAGLGRDLRRLRRTARTRPRRARPAGSRGRHPHRHRLAELRVLRPRQQHRK